MMPPLPIEVSGSELASVCRRWKIRELSLFGSVLRDDFAPESDVDVLVTFADDADWSLWDLVEAQHELASIVGRDIDLVEKRCLTNPFRRQAILASRRVIYAAE